MLKNIDNYVMQINAIGFVSTNFAKWTVIGSSVWPNNFIGKSYVAEINYLKDWIGM